MWECAHVRNSVPVVYLGHTHPSDLFDVNGMFGIEDRNEFVLNVKNVYM